MAKSANYEVPHDTFPYFPVSFSLFLLSLQVSFLILNAI
jgi:hypothetical protein